MDDFVVKPATLAMLALGPPSAGEVVLDGVGHAVEVAGELAQLVT